jgi:penicillin-binding protein-related factor A (putative recombinase)
MELKMMKDKKPFPFNKLSEYQVKNLWSAYEAGGESFVIINYRFGGYSKAFCLNFATLFKLKQELDRKSVPLELLEQDERVIKIEKIDHGEQRRWDVAKVVN